jgi:hypothetical protein
MEALKTVAVCDLTALVLNAMVARIGTSLRGAKTPLFFQTRGTTSRGNTGNI